MTSSLDPALGLVRDLASPFRRAVGRSTPRVGGRPGRTHVEVRGVHGDGDDEPRRLVEKQVLAVPGVHGVVTNSALGRLVVDHDATMPATALLAAVQEAEQALGRSAGDVPDASAAHPADDMALIRQLVALGLDVTGLAAVLVERSLTPLPAASTLVPPAVTTALSLVDAVPTLRALAERTAGSSSTESWFSVGSATVQALGRGPLGLVADACYRVVKANESAARARTWRRWDEGSDLAEHRAAPCRGAADDRATTLPAGPVERVADGMGLGTVGGLALLGALLPQRAVAVAAAGVPKSARWGREAFAAAAGRVLATRGVLVLDPSALRRADRVDVLVVDAAAPRTPAVEGVAGGVGRVVGVTPGASVHDVVVTWQRRGHGVALVTDDPDADDALAAADVSIFRSDRDGTAARSAVAWHADVVCPDAAG